MTKHITLGVTGCIGAYKAILVLRGLQQLGATVEVVMTESATRFIQPLTFQALSGKPVYTSHWGRDDDTEIAHIALAQRTDALVIAPATANCLAKLAHGIADDFLSTVYLAATCPTFVAPAMNVEMWRHPATQENLARLRARGVRIIEPEAGFLACGMVGDGRLADPAGIVGTVWTSLAAQETTPRDLTGNHVLVTAGPTIEDIDPVRYLTNRSSGKMGYAVARAAHARGATVTLISGPTRLSPPEGVETIAVRSTREMYDAVLRYLPAATLVIKAAAVCDYRPRQVAVEKLKKTQSPLRQLDLEPTEDILAAVGARKGSRFVVGFAAETGWSREAALEKLRRKGADLLVFNDVTEAGAGFDTDTNRATFVLATGETRALPLMTKDELAHEILNLARPPQPVVHPQTQERM
ncbi:bifunctional phosphopantothenoylcysteine decarboxylase/phosphopantothenate--cysteine ligase CoaBC [Chloracidobacterium sp. MS 40/45]|jgi:phosphopantothenoylcysteine decarboxylase/phosphopantothenate--cysteine ligase|uniref:bifunctional phosphopantothenoylcysteine decarboxylase/phosphopantothenate--cysteine ligase CoaBC n=1 Tax=Chloracidobacterium aggregatum TaxID=2851959 RepID=UPI001B8C9016|nr:bifunctional phosphopantothenoylcysteine decarboxylase/phosphopantothenate--cysteine ligase CoaBC [Chloracidobacterium aggregatum]QUV98996.1 bifunctional phosphopantothenoylcysteine decarboxylase/phosphopantothenate--cysteine ligase CoaBC [Chloracidobacterium sp. MS 40/45]